MMGEEASSNFHINFTRLVGHFGVFEQVERASLEPGKMYFIKPFHEAAFPQFF